MKLTKKLEAEIKALMEDYWNSYFEGNLDHWAGYLVDNYRNIGGTEEEIWNSKQEIVDYTYRIIDQMQGVTELRNKQTQIIPYDPYIMVHELLDIYIKLEGQWTFYQKFRLSSLIQKTSEGWKVLHQHGSYPDSKTLKGEAFAFDEIKAENIKLIEAVKSRTIELEEKNRELEIESSLERVRTVAMGMKKPDDLLNICEVLFIELNKIGFKNMRCSLIHIFNDEQNYFDDYDYSDFTGGKISTIPFKGNAVVEDFLKRIRKSKDSFAEVVVKGKALEEFLSFRKKSGQIQDKRLLKAKEINYYFFSVGIGNIGISNFGKISHKQLLLLKRFRNVFHLAYQRYTDISLAEAQSKEAQIELGLERVRARAMAMQKSDELKELIATVSSELGKLDLVLDRCIIMTYDSKTLGSTWWMANPETPEQGIGLFVKYHEHSPYLAHLNAWRNRIGKWEYVLEGEVKKEWDKFLFVETELSLLPEFVIANMRAKERVYFSASFNNFGCLSIAALEPLTDQQIDIMLRFAKVFDLTYTRFNDLQKAEAQAKEAKIEAALERVRSRTMAMQKSDELLDVASVLFQQVKALGVPQWNCGFNIWDIGDKEFTYYPGSPDGIIFPSPCKIPLTEHPVFIRFDASRKRGDELLVYEKEGQEQKDHYQYMLSLPGVGDLLKSMLESGFQLPTFQIDHLANFAYGNLLFITYEHFPEMHDVFKRFARVFEQTYTRFLDLQKAEAQAREATIEAALESVRASSMAMHNSEDLKKVVKTLSDKLIHIGLSLDGALIFFFEKKKKSFHYWIANNTLPAPIQIDMPYDEAIQNNPIISDYWKAIETGQDFINKSYGGKVKDDYFRFAARNNESKIPEAVRKFHLEVENLTISLAAGKNSLVGINSWSGKSISQQDFKVLKRFAKVFEQAYTRFLDLQKAETQAREAKIESALERVRARALAMQEPDELKDVAAVLRHEMGLLGVEELETCSIYIKDINTEKAECWYALKEVRSTENRLVNDHFALDLNETWVGREMLQFYNAPEKQISIVMQGINRKEWINYCEEKSVPLRGYYGEELLARTYHLYKFSYGAIGAAAVADISIESWGLLKKAASVFSLAYSRFKDLTQSRTDLINLKEEKKRAEDALTNLQAAQTQLVQSEKMASLGELTAGIAHEIQNPLNFVNNFSEVSKELLDEMREAIEKGNTEDAKEIMNDVIQNLEKINHHGKRADGIVKGMLQHSRSSSGVKEPTDINALADEYVRLCYHGLRAKDKSFNATIKTDFDESIEKINVIPQDIGRVVLNLLTNAFYVVNEKKHQYPELDYEPTVTIKTSSIHPPSGSRSIQVKVSDNGGGIPQKILEKIFQPFFTTKPTGQGTGLGLSLSYDIITKGHNGELKVETKVADPGSSGKGEGSTFIIHLPL